MDRLRLAMLTAMVVFGMSIEACVHSAVPSDDVEPVSEIREISESELTARVGAVQMEHLFKVLTAANEAGVNGYRFHPRLALVAINELQPLGPELGVGVLNSYCRGAPGRSEGLILVMRGLFEAPQIPHRGNAAEPTGSDENDLRRSVLRGYFRPPGLGMPSWLPPDLSKYPHFPLAIVEDIPILPVSGYSLFGVAEDPEEHLGYLRQVGRWRMQKLHPKDDPLDVLEKFTAGMPADAHYDFARTPDELRTVIAGQLLRLIDTDAGISQVSIEDPPETVWAKFTEARLRERSLQLHWDPAANRYVARERMRGQIEG